MEKTMNNFEQQEIIKGNIRALLYEYNIQAYTGDIGQEVSKCLADDVFYEYWLMMVKLRSPRLGNVLISHQGNSKTQALIYEYEKLIAEWNNLRSNEIGEWGLLKETENANAPHDSSVKRMLVLDDSELKKEYDILGISKNINGTEKQVGNNIVRDVVRLSHIIVNRFRQNRIRKLFEDKTLKEFDDKIVVDNKTKGLKAEPFPRYNLKFVWTDASRINAGNKVELEARHTHLGTNSGLCGNTSQQTTLWIQLRHVNGIFSPTLTFNTLGHEMTHSAVGTGWVNHSQVKKEHVDKFKGGNFYLDTDLAKIDNVFGAHTPLFWIYFMDRTVNGLGASSVEFVYGELNNTTYQEEFGKLCSINTIPSQFSISDVFKCYYPDVRHGTDKDTHLTSPLMDGATANREWYQIMSWVCDITTKSLKNEDIVETVQDSPEYTKESKLGVEKYLGFDLRTTREGDKFQFKLYLGEHNLNANTIWTELSKKSWTKTIIFNIAIRTKKKPSIPTIII